MATQDSLHSEQKAMSSAVYVDQAAEWADRLTRSESRRAGDYDNAMRRVSEKTGVGYRTLWGLRYRRPKRVFADIYFSLGSAYEALREAQLRALEAEIEEARQTGARAHYLDAASAVALAARGE